MFAYIHHRTAAEALHALVERPSRTVLTNSSLVNVFNLSTSDGRPGPAGWHVAAVASRGAPGAKAFHRLRIDLVAVDHLVQRRLLALHAPAAEASVSAAAYEHRCTFLVKRGTEPDGPIPLGSQSTNSQFGKSEDCQRAPSSVYWFNSR